jgi:glycosyltransferase involved in cell wall biosynthesis
MSPAKNMKSNDDTSGTPKKLLFLLSHPIQYFSPLFRLIAEERSVSLMVWYGDRGSLRGMTDEEFGKKIDWGIDLIGGYESRFFVNMSLRPRLGGHFLGVINPSMILSLIRHKPDAIVIHGWAYATYVIVWITAVLLRVPIWLRTESPWCQERLKTGWIQKIKRYVLRNIAFPTVSNFLAVGSQNAEWYRQLGVTDGRIHFVPYSVPFSGLTVPPENFHDIRKIFGIPDEEIVFLFVGKLIYKKRPADLLEAFGLCSSGHLVFVGDGRLRPTLEKRVELMKNKRVHFAGFADQKELPNYYRSADVLVLPSGMGETWGLVVNEALNFGLPVIVSSLCGSASDLVDEGKNGFTFDVGDVRALHQKMEWIISNRARLPEFSARSRQIVKRFDIRETSSEFIKTVRLFFP